MVMAESTEDLKYVCWMLQEEYSKWGLTINIAKRECLLPLGAEPFVFQFATQKFKDQDI